MFRTRPECGCSYKPHLGDHDCRSEDLANYQASKLRSEFVTAPGQQRRRGHQIEQLEHWAPLLRWFHTAAGRFALYQAHH